MGTLWGLSNQLVFTNAGIVAPGAKAYFFEAGTSTPKATYEDGDETTPNPHPVVADGNGRWPAVFLPFGSYKVQTTTSGGSAIGDTIDDIPNAAPTDPEDTVDEDTLLQTGDVIVTFVNGTRTGFVRCNGRTIGSASSGGTERANADTSDLYAFLWNNFSDTACAVSGGRGASAAADFAANKAIATLDLRGAALVGLADMGNSDNGTLNSVTFSYGSKTTGGSQHGANTHTLTEAQLPSHLHSVSITSGNQSADHTHSVSITSSSDGAHSHTISITDPGHSHTTSSTNLSGTKANEADAATAAAGYMNTGTLSTGSNTTGITASSNSTGAHTHLVSGTSGTVSATHNHSVSGNTGNTGSGSAHSIMQRGMTCTYLMKL